MVQAHPERERITAFVNGIISPACFLCLFLFGILNVQDLSIPWTAGHDRSIMSEIIFIYDTGNKVRTDRRNCVTQHCLDVRIRHDY